MYKLSTEPDRFSGTYIRPTPNYACLELLKPERLEEFLSYNIDGYQLKSAIVNLQSIDVSKLRINCDQMLEVTGMINQTINKIEAEIKRRKHSDKLLSQQRELERIKNLPFNEKLELEISSWCKGSIKTND